MPPASYACTLLYFCLLAASRLPSGGAAPLSIVERFEEWIVTHGRHYKDDAEKDARFEIFKSNVEYIDAFNRNGSKTYDLGVTQFADLTREEFGRKINIGRPRRPASANFTVVLPQDVPESMDWRTRGVVGPIKNQGECGACYAFTAVALVETYNAVNTGELLLLSEQQIIDCSVTTDPDDGCKGGTVHASLDYVIENEGLALARDYPYVERGTDPCDDRRVGHFATIVGFKSGPYDDEERLRQLVAVTPVAVGIQVGKTNFEYFQGDKVWDFEGDCGNEVWHGMVLIGYGVEPDGTKYWLVKNSFGKLWGNNGYAKIARAKPGGDPVGLCHLAYCPYSLY